MRQQVWETTLTTAWLCQTSWWLHYSSCTHPGTLHPGPPHPTTTHIYIHIKHSVTPYKIFIAITDPHTISEPEQITSWGSFSNFRLSPRLFPLPEWTKKIRSVMFRHTENKYSTIYCLLLYISLWFNDIASTAAQMLFLWKSILQPNMNTH